MNYKISSDRSTAVSEDIYYYDMATCPIAVKVLLLNPGGVAIIGQYDGKSTMWGGWYPLPRVRKENEQ